MLKKEYERDLMGKDETEIFDIQIPGALDAQF